MGHLISRALRRFTQCSQSAASAREQKDSTPSTSDQRQQQQQQNQRRLDGQEGSTTTSRPTVESIPVGQSIDSAEYASFEQQNKENKSDNNNNNNNKIVDQQQQQSSNTFNDNNNNNNNSVRLNGAVTTQPSDGGDQNKPEVEEAVIKIQALVRGHLTRKALKDAQQQNATPHPNALGQSQFDEESLTRNPPSAVFLPTSPLNLNLSFTFADQTKASNRLSSSSKVPLESIAEDNENNTHNLAPAPFNGQPEHNQPRQSRDDTVKLRLSPLVPSADGNCGDSVSPVPSEANASIDLNCDTPASASIDISDHNVKPTDRIASVLHHKTPTSPQINIREAPQDIETTTTTSTRIDTPPPSPIGDSSGGEEQAAAIRIQSAFRGYKTRKHSPYRRRSPTGNGSSPGSFGEQCQSGALATVEQSSPAATGSTKRILRQQDATVIEQEDECPALDNEPNVESKDDMDEGIEEDAIGRVAQVADMQRRLSRQRQRDSGDGDGDKYQGPASETPATADPTPVQPAASIDEMTAIEDTNTVREVKPQLEDEPQSISGALEAGPESISMSLGENISAGGVQSQASTFNNTGLSAALDGAHGGSSAAPGASLITDADQSQRQQQRPSVGAKSEAGLSLELDTDSSNLGANLSLTEETTENLSTQSAQILPGPALGTTIDEADKSLGVSLSDELESEARRLVDELTAEDVDEDEQYNKRKTVAALEEVTNILEEELEQATRDEEQVELLASTNTTNEPEASSGGEAALLSSGTLADVEQRTIELESDDIERRDPRGQVSEERAKSPQITSERPPLIETLANTPGDQRVEGVNDQENGEQEQEQRPQQEHNLKVATTEEEIISGRSSPALLSSNGGSSSDDEAAGSDQAAGGGPSGETRNQQQKQVGGGGGGKNKKKNRNKKKGGKK